MESKTSHTDEITLFGCWGDINMSSLNVKDYINNFDPNKKAQVTKSSLSTRNSQCSKKEDMITGSFSSFRVFILHCEFQNRLIKRPKGQKDNVCWSVWEQDAFTQWFKHDWRVKNAFCLMYFSYFLLFSFSLPEHCVLGQQDTSWLVWHIQVLYSHHGETQYSSSLWYKNPHSMHHTWIIKFYHSHSNTLEPLSSPFHFLVQFAPSINNSTSDKMEANDWACFLFMVGWQSVQLKVEAAFFFLFFSIFLLFWD